MLPVGKSTRSGVAFFAVETIALGGIAFAFLGDFGAVLAFLGFVSVVADAMVCPALALGIGFGVTAFGLLDDFWSAGILGFASVTAAVTGCPVLPLGADFSAVAIVGFFIVG
jgi:hypothetical protein